MQCSHQGTIQHSQGAALANKIGALGYVACSAKTGEGIKRLEELIVREGRRIDANALEIEATRKKKRKNTFCDIALSRPKSSVLHPRYVFIPTCHI